MKGFISILKGRNFQKGKIKNSFFLLKDSKENKDINNTENDFFPKINNNNNIRLSKIIESKKLSNIIKTKYIQKNNDYEDLFFYFLKTTEKIDIFESILDKNKRSNKKYNQIKKYEGRNEKVEEEDDVHYYFENKAHKKKINLKKIFYQELYLNLINNKIQWENFLFPKGVFNIMYQKSRLKQKEILKYSLKYNKDYDTVINSYEKTYTSLMLKHNWTLNPKIAYNNYYKIFLKKNVSQNKENNKKININDTNYSDVVIKVDNNGQGKTLIYIGKLFNVYIDDSYKKMDKNDNVVSMDIKEKKSRKEVVYNYKDLLARNKNKLKSSFSYDKKPNNKIEKRASKCVSIKKLNDNNNLNSNLNYILNNIRKKNNSFTNKNHNIPNNNIKNVKRFNTESNKIPKQKKIIFKNNSSFNSILNANENTNNNIINNKINYCLTYENENKGKNILCKIKEYKKNIRKKKNINNIDDTQKRFSFSPNLSKPVVIKESDIKINFNKPLYSKLIFNKKNKNQKNENQRNEKMILNFFKNNSDFYYY